MALDDTELLDPTALTVDDLEREIETGDYTIDELREIRATERESDNPRTTALEAIDEELDALTIGPDQPGSRPASQYDDGSTENGITYDPDQRISDGGGGTVIGIDGVTLPNPYAKNAPKTLQIDIPAAMGFAGHFFNAPGTYSIPYAEPHDGTMSGMRIKRSLETGTNTVTLSVRDPLHPEHAKDEREA